MQVSWPFCLIPYSWEYIGLKLEGRWCLNIEQLLWTSLSSRSPSQGIPLCRSLKRLKLALQKFRDLVLLSGFCCHAGSWVPPCHGHYSKGCPQTFISSANPCWFVSTRSINTPFLVGSSTACVCIIRGLWELPGLRVPSHVVPPTNVQEVEVPQEKQGCYFEATSSCSQKAQ